VATAGRTILIPSQTVVFVYAGLVITGVTACATGLVARRRPINDIRVVLMTLGAKEIATMILWLIRESGMSVVGRYPRIRAVAHTAVLHGVEVAGILPGGRSAVVTRRTGSEDLRVIHGRYGCPNRGVMAILANIGRQHVGRSLANSIGTVVAANTVVHDVDVVEVGGQPGNGGMAVIAIIAAGDVGRVFSGRYDAVMTRAAGTNDLCVVDRVSRSPDV